MVFIYGHHTGQEQMLTVAVFVGGRADIMMALTVAVFVGGRADIMLVLIAWRLVSMHCLLCRGSQIAPSSEIMSSSSFCDNYGTVNMVWSQGVISDMIPSHCESVCFSFNFWRIAYNIDGSCRSKICLHWCLNSVWKTSPSYYCQQIGYWRECEYIFFAIFTTGCSFWRRDGTYSWCCGRVRLARSLSLDVTAS